MLRGTWRVVTGPTTEPVTLAEAKAQCRVLHSSEDTLITALITAAREYAETRQWRALITQTRELTLDRWPCGDVIELPGGRVSAITSVTYTNTAGADVVLSASGYTLDSASEPGRIYPAYGASWPSLRDVRGAVRIRYVVGAANAAAVRATTKQGILLTIGHWYANRESVAIGTIATEVPQSALVLLDMDSLRVAT